MTKPSSRSRNKSSRKPDTAIMLAVIALVGTIITAVLSSPVIVALIQKTPTPTSSIPFPTNPPVTISVPNPSEGYLPPTLLPSGDGIALNSTESAPSSPAQPEMIEMVFSNPTTTIIHFVIETDEGFPLLQIAIPPGTSQIVYMPSGSYHYEFRLDGHVYFESPSGDFHVTSKNELCFSPVSLVSCSLSNP